MLRLRRERRFGGVTVAGVPQEDAKNRGAQLLFVLAMLVTGFGGVLSSGGSVVGYVLVVVGLVALIAIFLRALKRWDY